MKKLERKNKNSSNSSNAISGSDRHIRRSLHVMQMDGRRLKNPKRTLHSFLSFLRVLLSVVPIKRLNRICSILLLTNNVKVVETISTTTILVICISLFYTPFALFMILLIMTRTFGFIALPTLALGTGYMIVLVFRNFFGEPVEYRDEVWLKKMQHKKEQVPY